MKQNTDTTGRLLRSAQELKAYFEEKQKRDPLQEGQRTSVLDALDGLILSAAELESQAQESERLERRAIGTQEELPSNVISIRRKRQALTSVYNAVRDKRWVLRLDCMIESRHISEIHKMASELHSHSQRYAFIEYRDLDKRARLSVSEILEVGTISLFVPSILDLTAAEQEILFELIQHEGKDRPLLMVGSTLPYSELLGEPSVNLQFLNQLASAYIKLTKPFSEYKEQGLIHYFLDSLSDSPS